MINISKGIKINEYIACSFRNGIGPKVTQKVGPLVSFVPASEIKQQLKFKEVPFTHPFYKDIAVYVLCCKNGVAQLISVDNIPKDRLMYIQRIYV